jgi:hypothetical protein
MGIVLSLGGLLYLIGWIWLVVIAFRTEGIVWGVIVLLFGWVGGLIFCLVKKAGWAQFALMVVGMVIAGGWYGFYMPVPR